jgi:hypothetical protein
VISLPVSSKAPVTSFFSGKYHDSFTGDNPALIHWYQLRGSLQDSKNPVSTERALIPVDGKIPRWLPYDNSYGLSAGTDEAYLTPPISFYREGGEEGGGQFLVRFKPVSEGAVLSVFFGSKHSPGENAAIADLILREGNPVLRLSVPEGAVKEIALPVHTLPDSHIAVLAGFYISAKQLEAKICLESDPGFQQEAGSIDLTIPPSGEARVRLGTPAGENGKTGSAGSAEKAPAFAESSAPLEHGTLDRFFEGPESGDVYSAPEDLLADGSDTAGDGGIPAVRIMWNELAVLYSSTPIFEKAAEEPPPEEEDHLRDSTPPEEEETAVSGQENEEQTALAASPPIPEPAGPVPASPDPETETSQDDKKDLDEKDSDEKKLDEKNLDEKELSLSKIPE